VGYRTELRKKSPQNSSLIDSITGVCFMITKHIKLSVEMESYIRDKVAGGSYRNSTEVIQEAICRMQAEDERSSTCRATMAKGQAQPHRNDEISSLKLVERAVRSTGFHPVFELSD
jgi:putative addiction module CopG family antidote